MNIEGCTRSRLDKQRERVNDNRGLEHGIEVGVQPLLDPGCLILVNNRVGQRHVEAKVRTHMRIAPTQQIPLLALRQTLWIAPSHLMLGQRGAERLKGSPNGLLNLQQSRKRSLNRERKEAVQTCDCERSERDGLNPLRECGQFTV